MGADIQVLGGQIVYNGPTQLSGAPVKASDLRAGAALVTAGLMADGQTEITNIEFILRGIQISLRNFLILVRIFV